MILIFFDKKTYNEIVNTIQHMKNNKAIGPAGIVIEMLKYADVNILCWHTLYNSVLLTGEFSNALCKTVISPIHKKGNKSDLNN